VLAALAVARYFAVEGGEYGTIGFLAVDQVAGEPAQVLRLRQVVDSLTREPTVIEHDLRT
jgi:hypothetical protein